MVEVTCHGCGREFEAQRASAKYCGDTCRKRGNRRGSAESAPGTGGPVEQLGDDSADRVGLVATYRDALAAVDRVNTPLGQHVLVLARKMDSAFETGSGVAALSRQLDAVFDKAMKGVAKGDALDDLEARRQAKLEAASRAG